jgi:hypothetical protein
MRSYIALGPKLSGYTITLFTVEGCRGGGQHGPWEFVGEATPVMRLYNLFDGLHHISFRTDKLAKGMNHLSFMISIIVC